MEELQYDKFDLINYLLDRIERTNEMIKLHHDDPLMRDQYQEIREELLQKFREGLAQFDIQPTDLAA